MFFIEILTSITSDFGIHGLGDKIVPYVFLVSKFGLVITMIFNDSTF